MPYAVTPVKAIVGPLDYDNQSHMKLYFKGCANLQEEEYDLEAEGSFNIIEALETRGHDLGWTQETEGLTWIPDPNTAEDDGCD